MICAACRAEGKRSTVEVVRSNNGTLKPRVFFDEDGRSHAHNPNVIVTEFECSNGHRFAERSSWECWCGYKVATAEVVPA